MTARVFHRDDLALKLHDSGGDGPAVVMQHGLCGAEGQIAELVPAELAADLGVRRLTLECRGHGGSEAGDPAAFSIATFADDLAAALDALSIRGAILGGVSMGAAIASRLAVRRPDLVSALVLMRPAWVSASAPDNMAPNLAVGRLIAAHPPEEARALFEASPLARRLATEAPDNLASLEGFFSREPLAVTSALLTAISLDGPGISEQEIASIAVPALVVGHDLDVVHPFGHAERLAALIPGARLARITPKGIDKARYLTEFGRAFEAFVTALPAGRPSGAMPASSNNGT